MGWNNAISIPWPGDRRLAWRKRVGVDHDGNGQFPRRLQPRSNQQPELLGLNVELVDCVAVLIVSAAHKQKTVAVGNACGAPQTNRKGVL